MIYVHAVDAEARLKEMLKRKICAYQRRAHHPSPLPVLQILLRRTADALRHMKAEQAVVVLSDDVLS